MEVDVAMFYISTDASLTSANITSVVALLSDEELKDVLGGVSDDSREQQITTWMMTIPAPTWEYLGGLCFYGEKEKALEEVKKQFKRKLGMLLIHRPHLIWHTPLVFCIFSFEVHKQCNDFTSSWLLKLFALWNKFLA